MRSFFSLQTFATVLLTVLVVFIAITLYGMFFGTVNINIGNSNFERTFTVDGQGKVKVTPDTFTSTITVIETGNTQEEAQQAGNTTQNEVVKVLNELGFAEGDIKTTQYSVNPQYDFTQSRRTQNGFEFMQNTTIETKDRAVMEQALDRVGALGVNIGGISFEVDQDAHKQEATKMAIEDAKVKAEELAQAGGFKVGKIVTISEYGASPDQPFPYQSRSALPGSEEMKQDAIISPGTDEVVSNVTITYFIK